MAISNWVRIFTAIGLFSGVFAFCQADEPSVSAATAPAQSVVKTHARMDPAHPPRVGHDYYPKLSLLLREQGRCVVNITIGADGNTRDPSIKQSTGYPRLDEACLQVFVPGHLIPATEDGKPVEVTVGIPVVWHLD
jgi:periplasmic protein TonB